MTLERKSEKLLSAYRNDAVFRNLLMRVKSWGGCAPINPGKENHPAVLFAVECGVLTIGNERLGPLGVPTGQQCVSFTGLGWDLVGRPEPQANTLGGF